MITSETNFLWHQDEELEVVAGVPEQKESAAQLKKSARRPVRSAGPELAPQSPQKHLL